MPPYLIPYIMQMGKALGSLLLGILMQVLAGRALKRLVMWPFQWLAARTRNKKDDQLVKDAEQDLGIADKEEK